MYISEYGTSGISCKVILFDILFSILCVYICKSQENYLVFCIKGWDFEDSQLLGL